MELNERTRDTLFDLGARINAVYPLVGVLCNLEAAPEWLEDFAEQLDGKDAETIFAALPELRRFSEGDEYPSASELADALVFARRGGYVIDAQWCVRRYLDQDTFVGGWGHCQLTWFYAETVEAGIDQLIHAASTAHEKARAEAGAA